MKNINLFTLVSLLIILSCSNNDDEHSKSYALNERGIQIHIFDNQNQDLLDSLTSNYFPKQNIKVYYLNNGEKELVTDADGDFEPGSFLYKEKKPMVLGFGTSYYADTIIGKEKDFDIGRSTTYLEFNDKVVDTIVTEWKRGSNYFIVQKMWYNNAKEPYDVRSTDIPYKVIKDIN